MEKDEKLEKVLEQAAIGAQTGMQPIPQSLARPLDVLMQLIAVRPDFEPLLGKKLEAIVDAAIEVHEMLSVTEMVVGRKLTVKEWADLMPGGRGVK